MADRELTLQDAHAAYKLLDSIDPDDVPDDVLSAIVWNKKALSGLAQSFQQQQQQAIQPYLVTDEDGDLQRPGEDEEVHTIEAMLGVKLDAEGDEWQELDEQLGEVYSETHEVTLATVPISKLREVDLTEHLNVNGETENDDLLDRWAFMLEVNV